MGDANSRWRLYVQQQEQLQCLNTTLSTSVRLAGIIRLLSAKGLLHLVHKHCDVGIESNLTQVKIIIKSDGCCREIVPVYSLFLSPIVNNLTEATQEKNRCILAHGSGVQSIITGKSWRLRQLHL